MNKKLAPAGIELGKSKSHHHKTTLFSTARMPSKLQVWTIKSEADKISVKILFYGFMKDIADLRLIIIVYFGS